MGSARLPRMFKKLLKGLGFLAYGGAVLAVFFLAGYISFSLFVRSGATPVPDLVGLSEQEARDRLSDQGLELTVEDARRFDESVEAGMVVQQTPSKGVLVKRGSSLAVVLSLGPQRIAVPDLSGQSLQSAQVNLAAAGLAVGRTLGVYGDRGGPGAVHAQVPAPGEPVAPGSTIDLMLNLTGTTDAYVMPDLVYRDYNRVRRFFEGRGFRMGSVKFEQYVGLGDGVILRQFPLAGHPLRPQDTISLVVAASETNGF